MKKLRSVSLFLFSGFFQLFSSQGTLEPYTLQAGAVSRLASKSTSPIPFESGTLEPYGAPQGSNGQSSPDSVTSACSILSCLFEIRSSRTSQSAPDSMREAIKRGNLQSFAKDCGFSAQGKARSNWEMLPEKESALVQREGRPSLISDEKISDSDGQGDDEESETECDGLGYLLGEFEL